MEGLSLSLLGHPTLHQDGQVIELKSRKGWALLTYLALTPHPVGREILAALFWPEQEAVAARRNLRRLLYTLNQTPIESILQTEGETIALTSRGNVDVDVLTFLADVENESWVSAACYSGLLLDGMTFGDTDRFEAWLRHEREGLQQKQLLALGHLTEAQLAAGNWTAAQSTLQRQLVLDSYNEALWRQLMSTYMRQGERAKALDAYHSCRQLLRGELGIDPSPETVSLYKRYETEPADAVAKPIPHLAAPPPAVVPHLEARELLLESIARDWIDAVLHPSLHGHPPISLYKKSQPDALAHPWTTLSQRSAKRQRTVLNQKSTLDIFEQEGRTLLILGEPGAGKTTALLTIAAEMGQRAVQDPAHPLPIVLPLASWKGEPFQSWVIQELNETYRILPSIVADWLAGHHLILFCDGLDEVPTERQPACVAAINQFRREDGLTPMVVTARRADYEALLEPLNLNAAIDLQPINRDQLHQYAGAHYPQLDQLFKEDPKLGNLARKPLFLSLLVSLLSYFPVQNLKLIGDKPTQLFALYVEQMLSQKSRGSIPSDQLIIYLRWLAKQLKMRNQPIFLLDRIQPDWLERPLQIGLYFLFTRFFGAFLLGAAWSFRDSGWAAIGIGVFFGVVVALAEMVLFFWPARWRPRGREPVDLTRLWRALVIGGITLLANLAVGAGIISIANGVIFGLFFGWRPPHATPEYDIRLVEKLAWRWPTFGIGLASGVVIGLLTFFTNPSNLYQAGTSLLSFGVLFGVFGGLLGRSISTKTRPNEGMRLSWRNGLIGGAAVGGAMLLSALIIEAALDGPLWVPLLVGVQYFAMAALWYGGLDLINHYMLRLFLTLSGKLPWGLVPLLEQASHQTLLYRVGSGYLFLHPQLRDYLAEG
ncbi:MAG: BTAD domain-containing putative transcriptional regulator [Chloroflexota bacterium]